MLYNGMTFGEWLRKHLEKSDITPSELARRMEVTPGYVGQLLSDYRKPGRSVISKLSSALNISAGDLHNIISGRSVGDNLESSPMPDDSVPLISWVQAGKWHEAIDSYPPGVAEDWIPYETNSKGVFALRVKGDSMEPEYRDGDIIIVNPQIEAQAGDDVIAKYRDNEVTFKRLKKQNDTVLLSPLNHAHPDIIITGKDLKNYRVIGVVESLMRKRKRK